MGKRIAAIVLIFCCTSFAWMILGASLAWRTQHVDSELRGRVTSTWGATHEQKPPVAEYGRTVERPVEVFEGGRRTVKTETHTDYVVLPLERSRLAVDLDLTHRRKGLMWYSTYAVRFAGTYGFRNPSDTAQTVRFRLEYPTGQAIYDDLRLTLDGKPLEFTSAKTGVVASATLAPGATASLDVGYRSQGLDRWTYRFGDDVSQVRDFKLDMKTNFRDVDFPENTLSPTTRERTSAGWNLHWNYLSLMSGYQIAMAMPERLQPGPLAGRISMFAPVSLLFFFFVLFILTALRGIDLHPMNYFFLAAAFFAFHLLMAYLVDLIPLEVAFAICSLVSTFLVVSYLRLVVGMRFAAVEAGLAQLLYLVLFSYAFFFRGITGLAVTVGAILTLFVAMQVTGRIRWSEAFAPRKA